MANEAEKVDVSGVVTEDHDILRAQFAYALRGRTFEKCTVTWAHRADRQVRFSIVFEDGTEAADIAISPEELFVEDQIRVVPINRKEGEQAAWIHFVPDGHLPRLVDSLFLNR